MTRAAAADDPSPARFRSDCSRCVGLCCVAHAFVRSVGFGIDKANDEPCPHLQKDNHCTIHAERSERGFDGCIVYECYGAGQRVTQDLFGGRSWHDEPDILAPMMQAFRSMRLVHELQMLLAEAAKMPLSADEKAALLALEERLEPAGGWSPETLARFANSDVPRRTRAFLVTLGHHVAGGKGAARAAALQGSSGLY